MNGRANAELVFHLGRIASGEGLAERLTAAQWAALRYFAQANRFSQTPSAFAAFHATTRGTASQTIKSLETQGYLTRIRSEGDRRSIRLVLTEKARGILANDPFESLVRAADSLPPQCSRPLRQCLAAHARSGGAREVQTSLRHLHVVSTSGKRRLQPGGTGALCVRVHERAPVSGRTRRGLHQLHPGQARNGEGPCHWNRTAMSPVPHQRSPKSARPRPRDEYVGRDPGNHSCKPQHCT